MLEGAVLVCEGGGAAVEALVGNGTLESGELGSGINEVGNGTSEASAVSVDASELAGGGGGGKSGSEELVMLVIKVVSAGGIVEASGSDDGGAGGELAGGWVGAVSEIEGDT